MKQSLSNLIFFFAWTVINEKILLIKIVFDLGVFCVYICVLMYLLDLATESKQYVIMLR